MLVGAFAVRCVRVARAMRMRTFAVQLKNASGRVCSGMRVHVRVHVQVQRKRDAYQCIIMKLLRYDSKHRHMRSMYVNACGSCVRVRAAQV